MGERLLGRQVRLLEYLTSRSAIFGDGRTHPIDPVLHGINRGRLDLEARFSHAKRMDKIVGVFPITFALLGADADALVREFASARPPHDISRIDNARQFHEFLIGHQTREPHLPPYLLDVAACEMACVEARALANATTTQDIEQPDTPRPAVRRNRGITLLRTAFDIRIIFEGGVAQVPDERVTHLAIAWMAGEPNILELTLEVFEVLAALDRWVALDDLPGVEDLAVDLAGSGLLELRR